MKNETKYVMSISKTAFFKCQIKSLSADYADKILGKTHLKIIPVSIFVNPTKLISKFLIMRQNLPEDQFEDVRLDVFDENRTRTSQGTLQHCPEVITRHQQVALEAVHQLD